MIGDCGSCGARDVELSPVLRVYLLPEPTVVEEVEWWCFPCRTQYPHEDAPEA